jgi:hypothetical protein
LPVRSGQNPENSVPPVKNFPISLFVWFVLAGAARTSWGKSEKAGLSSGLRGDKVLTPSPRRSEGPCDQLGALSEPHGEQNLYANPKRTAKFSINKSTYKNSDVVRAKKVQTILIIFTAPETAPPTT